MKKIIPLLTASTLCASASNVGDYLKFSGDIRARFEARETDPADPSTAFTVSTRLGLEIGEFNGFSAFIQGEGTYGLARDFRSNPSPAPQTRPFVVGNSVIGDPDNAEINQAYLQYSKDGFLVKVGRQSIVRGGAQHIGNVAWRQNMQTFDAAQIGYKKENFSVSYVYSDRAQRIFGIDPDANNPLEEFQGDFHFIDADYKTDFGKIAGYVYLIDVDSFGNGLLANVGESNTYGAYVESDSYYAEFAFQDGTSNLQGGDYDAIYAHLKYSTKIGGAGVAAGLEYLGDGFKTPFSTVHKFNGFADAFILQRIGLNAGPGGNFDGIADFYLNYSRKDLPGGIIFKGALHAFMDEDFEDTYGYEADAVLVKKFSPELTGLLKAAYFSGEDFYEDIKQVSVQLDYKF